MGWRKAHPPMIANPRRHRHLRLEPHLSLKDCRPVGNSHIELGQLEKTIRQQFRRTKPWAASAGFAPPSGDRGRPSAGFGGRTYKEKKQ
jgi:hypothetical protein